MDDLSFAKKLLEIGDKDGALKEISTILENNPSNIEAWLLYAQVTDNINKKKDCYREVLRYDPNNIQAEQELKRLLSPTYVDTILNPVSEYRPQIQQQKNLTPLIKVGDYSSKETIKGKRFKGVISLIIGLVLITLGTWFLIRTLKPVFDKSTSFQSTTKSIDAYITISVNITSENLAVVNGQTNLPDGTIIMITVNGTTNLFNGQDKVTVSDSKFTSASFGPYGGLESGAYTVEALMPFPKVQPASVQQVIGTNGENLTGNQLVYEEGSVLVVLTKSFEIIVPTATPSRTHTPTRTRTPTITPTSTPWFTESAQSLCPAEDELPNDFMIDTAATGPIELKYGDEYQCNYTSNYPNINGTDDAYLVSYDIAVFYNEEDSKYNFNQIEEKWIIRYFPTWFYGGSTGISPHQVEIIAPNVDDATGYLSNFEGPSNPGYFVFIKVRVDNLLIVSKTLSHNIGNRETIAIAQANYFIYLVLEKLNL